jgi:penicillin-binding protein 1C
VRRFLRPLFIALALPFLLAASVVGASLFLSVPDALSKAPRASRYVRDRHGLLLARTRGEGDDWFRPVERHELGSHFVAALLAAEDARFFSHPGIDPWAIVRAGFSALKELRIVSGASTLTQQLARTEIRGYPRPLRKLWEMSLALRLEAAYSKDEILELYVNRVHFGPKVLGVGAASERYFGKELRELDLSEAATLAGLVRGPSLYDLERHPELALRRRDRILERLRRSEVYSNEVLDRALGTPLVLHALPPLLGAPHWVRTILERAPLGQSELDTPLDLGLQRELERIARGHLLRLRSFEASALSIVVVDNSSAEILAYVGSPDFHAAELDGQVDGANARRQPGSALKPFIYAAAIDQLGMDAETVLLDEPLSFLGALGYWAPQNYDHKFRGQVTLRRALANSLNVPAVQVLTRLGLERGLEALHLFGFASLSEPASYYGPALALGAGEITLIELVGAYAALARGGSYRAPRFLKQSPKTEAQAACSPRAAQEISSILADSAARREVFGASNDFDFAYPVSTKTGTSKGYRDAWAMGYTEELTVGVWVGNFDGRPMRLGSGAGSAGPIFHEVFERAVARRHELYERASGAIAIAPRDRVPRAEGVAAKAPSTSPLLIFPKAGMHFRARTPSGRGAELRLRALGLGPSGKFWVGGRALAADAEGTALWALERGAYEIFAQDAAGARTPPVWVQVD